MADQKDYVIVRFLPALFDKPRDLNERLNEFTYDQARQLRFQGLPVRINHAKGESAIVGRVEASVVHPGTREAYALLSIDQNHPTHTSIFTSNALSNGFYSGASLSHDWTLYANYDAQGHMRTPATKQPLEISVCQEGLRPNTDVKAFFPCAKTLSRLEKAGKLDEMLALYGFGGSVSRSKSSGDSYISDLAATIEKKRRIAISKFRFTSSSPMSSGTVSASANADPPAEDQAAMQTDQMSSPADPPAQTEAVVEPVITEKSDRTKMLETLVSEQKRADDLASQLQAQQSQLAELETLRQRQAEIEAEREAEKKKAEDEARREAELHMRTIEEVVAAKRLDSGPDGQRILETCRGFMQDPVANMEGMRAIAGMVKAASTKVADVERNAELLARTAITEAEKNHQRALISQYNSARAQSYSGLRVSNGPASASVLVGQTNASASSAGMNARFQTTPTSAGSTAEIPIAAGTNNSSATGVSTPTPSVDPNSKTWARDSYAHLKQTLGREPTYAEVASGGVKHVWTGGYEASANGLAVKQMRAVPVFQEPRAFGAQVFAPNFHELLKAAARKGFSRRAANDNHRHAMSVTSQAFFDLSKDPKDRS